MRPSQIIAVDHVVLEGDPSAIDDLLWMYAELVGLKPVHRGMSNPGAGELWLCFRSGNLELRYRLVTTAVVEPVACRLQVEVPVLRSAEAALDERRIPYERLRGLHFTDRRLSLLDPAGNRVEIKQHWPESF